MPRRTVKLLAALAAAWGIPGSLAAQPLAPDQSFTAEPPASSGSEAVDRLNAVVSPQPEAPPTPPPPPPYGGPFLERPKLTGDWLGTRDSLRDHGITWVLASAAACLLAAR